MAYKLKYWQYVGKDESRVLIQVYVNGWTGRAYEMAHITGASLQIVGGNSDVLAPVIKTAFSWSLVDAWDEGATRADGTTCVDALMRKCGQWEEFFTPDATKFKVVVSAAPVGGLSRAIWTGYVTPDSWSEDLIYRGSITITARDMLGSLQEAEFDMTGRVSVLQLVQGALGACACAMPIDYKQAHFLVNRDGESLLSHNLGALTYGGESWWTALTETLESLGLVLRWNGQNQLVLTSLRYLAEDTQAGCHEMEFINRSGMRELAAALKLVTETFDVEPEPYSAPDPTPAQMTRGGGPITCSATNHGETASGQIYGYYTTAENDEGWDGNYAIPLYGTIADGVPQRGMFFPTNASRTGGLHSDYLNPRLDGNFRFKIQQDGPLVKATDGTGSSPSFAPYTGRTYVLGSISLSVRCILSGTTYYLNANGAWVQEVTGLSVEPGEEVDVPRLNGATGYRIVITSVHTKPVSDNVRPVAPLLAALIVEIEENYPSGAAREFKTSTEYDLQNNVTITRKPKVASAPVTLPPDFCPNVLALAATNAQDEWNWPGEAADTFFPLAVMIQAQVLCFYSAPASVFTGTAHDGAVALPGWGLRYYGRDCVIVSGTYDFTSGFVSQLNAREVYSWEDVWGESFAPVYTTRTAATKGGTNDADRVGSGSYRAPSGSFNAEEFSDDFQITEQ